METGRYRSPYEYIRLSPVRSMPKLRYRSKRVDSFGLVSEKEATEMVVDLLDEKKKKKKKSGSSSGKPAD